MKDSHMEAQVAVLGGGLAGLAAANRLIHKGIRPIIIEKEEAPGGLCRSFRHKGFIFDLGGHRFLPHAGEVTDFVSGLFGNNDLCIRDRKSKIYLKKKFLKYPPEFFDILKNLGFATCFNCALDSTYLRLRHLIQKEPERSLQDWLFNRFGYTLYNMYFGPYSHKLWGRRPSNMSSEWAPERISVPNIGVAIQNLFTANHKPLKTYARKFLYPAGGIGEIPRRIAEDITKRGGRVFINHEIVKINVEPKGFVIEALAPGGEKKVFTSSKVISTIPLTEILNIIDPRPPQKVLNLSNNLRFRSVRFLNLMLDVPNITQNTWLYIPERKYAFFRIQEFSNWHPDNSPPGKTSLTLEIACDKGGRLWNIGDDELLQICIRDLKKIGIDVEGRIMDYFCTFAEHAYPIYSLKYRENLQKIYNFIKGLTNLAVCGRQGLFRYINMDKAIETGFDAAESLYCESKTTDLLEMQEKKEYLEKAIV